MPQVRILTDSSAYLPQVYADQYNIHVLPLTNLEGRNTAMALISKPAV